MRQSWWAEHDAAAEWGVLREPDDDPSTKPTTLLDIIDIGQWNDYLPREIRHIEVAVAEGDPLETKCQPNDRRSRTDGCHIARNPKKRKTELGRVDDLSGTGPDQKQRPRREERNDHELCEEGVARGNPPGRRHRRTPSSPTARSSIPFAKAAPSAVP